MAINVELRDEQCESIKFLDDVYLTSRHLPDYDDNTYPYLRLIDPYGDTVFSSYQMVAVLPELDTLARERPTPEIAAVLELARYCASSNGIHTYLTFIGD